MLLRAQKSEKIVPVSSRYLSFLKIMAIEIATILNF